MYGSTVGAPVYSDGSCGSSESGSVWYSMTVAPATTVTASTCNSNTDFDSVLSVYSGSCQSPVCVAQNNDDRDCTVTGAGASSVTWTSSDTTTYYIGVSGYSSSEGTYITLQKRLLTNLGTYELSIQTSVINVPCSHAFQVPGDSSTPFVIQGSTIGAPPSTLEICGLSNESLPVWYEITNYPIGTAVTLSTCSSYTNFHTNISVFSGSCSALQCETVTEDSCSNPNGITTATVTFTPDTDSYFVVIYGANGLSGQYQLTISH